MLVIQKLATKVNHIPLTPITVENTVKGEVTFNNIFTRQKVEVDEGETEEKVTYEGFVISATYAGENDRQAKHEYGVLWTMEELQVLKAALNKMVPDPEKPIVFPEPK